ncbi:MULTISPECIES: single-stranded-DNA-specific exonuclease RecJ [Lactococcus]|uniref:single-stranded-DNA-specific exonuclease RecJ n=1 Tax=Lactococcus TaxID=1357 RepID=UPI0002DC89AE|nr:MULTISPECIES: single-stranded-DNA-specific exonuclease RecJ [Lactococcus]MBS4463012.1 single-stranded-DNA-specific exonuclease RecJ [Lactococcus garvieae]MCO7129690.1 single-stranded-DNA-specific exonuclease RecJ [Lactococcus garvieae]MDB7634603.1 single-stranded-DNA-specific exonuclease RecJ [Lactococcus garvieae]QSQ98569.1 single-stranded-DNA-specific exonuclease RecJ [Lactococcus garvieae]UHU65263.1 single-stranded-DNA-specific exonuclease RecJ [Lactococcus garvieae]
MIKSKYIWKLTESNLPDEFLKLSKKYKLDTLAAQILWQRGIRAEEEIQAYLNPDLQQLHDPFLLHDMEKATQRILTAIENGQNILIYGDYDADGMTASSVMKSALDELGAEVQVYLPNRFTDGYGPNLDVYKYFIQNEDIDLIITVDNGVAGHEAIAYAQSQNVDVIVTDHHSMPEELPKAFAIVHPEHPESNYPFKYLAGVGVAFKVATALLDYIPSDMLDLVAIGTIADMVSLTDENRILVSHGLKVLANTERAGLMELMRLSGTDFEKVNEETVGFQIAPRLNALGRLDDPNPAIELLTGWDEEVAAEIAQMIDEKNSERKVIVENIYNQALTMMTDEPVEVLYHQDWHKGVLGIVAGRLLEQFHKPIIMLAEEEGILRGSARSIENFNIFEALNGHRELFIAFGGHKQAAGMTFALENVEAIKQVMLEFIQENDIDMSEKSSLEVQGSLQFDQISLETIRSLEKLSPYGMDNPKPHFLLTDYQVEQARSMGKDNSHLKLKLVQNGQALDAVYFGHGSESLEFEQSDTELVGTLSSNTWNGTTTVQLMVADARVNGVELLDIRSRQVELPKNTIRFVHNEVKNGTIEEVLIIEEAPTDKDALSALTELIHEQDFELIYFKNTIKKNYYLTGAGTREQFARFYKAIYQYPEFDIRFKLKDLANYLKIPDILMVKMIQIFEELNFVTIDNGMMSVNKAAEKRDISESNIYQELQEIIAFQELFALSPVKEIYKKLKEEDAHAT